MSDESPIIYNTVLRLANAKLTTIQLNRVIQRGGGLEEWGSNLRIFVQWYIHLFIIFVFKFKVKKSCLWNFIKNINMIIQESMIMTYMYKESYLSWANTSIVTRIMDILHSKLVVHLQTSYYFNGNLIIYAWTLNIFDWISYSIIF